MESLEWTTPSEYLSVDNLLGFSGEGGVDPMSLDEAAHLGLRPDFRELDNAIPTTLAGSEWNETSGPSCAVPVVTLTQEQLQTQSLGARGYRMLSVMRAVTLMPNMTVSTCLLSSDHVGSKLQLVFLISQEEFDSLLSGEC
ncbi:hypothetical protein BDM02DRAFT_3193187 [Thelephora ganbajun]|uniref:Uncharacterized protein n=1 Tax=Thelephora ganbajun TaxID=370292 RepID=A0ACB6YYT2_THEGA|nr:hypothetical protein BDM02DRAFT_3193187 [Thelephora ganbajun]